MLLAPLLLGVINRTKATIAGRTGPPLLQAYYDIWKLLRKGAVYSTGTTWMLRAGPVVGLACMFTALLLTPLGRTGAVLAFKGDVLLFAYALGLARFVTVLAALDTGSSFEGMGASREVYFAALAEPALLLSFVALAHITQTLSLSAMFSSIEPATWHAAGPALSLIAAALFVVALVENARIPIDDPATHLELTMIHEVMVLDHGGPDLALIHYAAALKLWLLGVLLANIIVPVATATLSLNIGATLAGVLLVAIVIGLIESGLARLRLVRVPHLLAGASALAVLAIILAVR
jgi:formate hydrogenlyase subunit 4